MVDTFIIQYRSRLHDPWFRTSDTAHFFEFCLLKANYKDVKWQNMVIKRGQFVSSLNNMSYETGLSIRKIRTSINRLKSTNHITCDSTNQNTIITVCNYDESQKIKNEKRQANRHTKRQVGDKQSTTNNNSKNKKNINRVFIPPSLKEFEDFFKERGYNKDFAQRVFEGYDTADWKDSRGNQVKNWKQKVLHNWFKPENKIANEAYEERVY